MDPALLEAALEGLQHRLDDVNEKIQEVRRSLGGMRGRAARPAGTPSATRHRRTMSAAARKKIAAAQRRRWAAFHAQTGTRKTRRKSAGKAAQAA